MSIQKIIFQTYKTSNLPFITRWHIYWLKRRNPEYDYQFYDDERIDVFIRNEYGDEVYALYKRINIGAAKADFFRYAVLYKKGGVYLDIDSLITKRIDSFIMPEDNAVIAFESNLNFYVQWVLFYEAGHPILKQTMEDVINNLKENKYPHDSHQMTGPTAYTLAIKKCLKRNPEMKYRQMGIDFDGNAMFSYPLSKMFLYGFSRKNHWKKLMKTQTVLKDTN